MTTICKNCNQQFEWHFCNNCGQSAETHKMNFHFLWHDIQHGLLHFDKGILYTSKQLFTRPGYSIREFIEGKRVNHFKPISLIIVLATVYGLLYHYFHINLLKVNYVGDFQSGFNSVKPAPGKTPFTFDINKLNEWVGTHYSWAALLQLPLYALGSFLAFRKSGFNYVEHLVLNAFLTGQRLVVHLVSFPLLYLYNETPTLSLVSGIIEFAGIALMVWAYIQFFDQYSKVKAFFLTLLSYFYYFILTLLVGGIGGLVMVVHYAITLHH
jgi:hypothetical protein